MRTILRWIRNIILLTIVIVMAAVIWTHGDFNLHSDTQQKTEVPENGVSYSLEDNALFKNIPLTQVKNVFNFMNKQEFMAVSGLSRMGYNEEYIAGQRSNDYILYRFGDKNVTVFKTEADLQQELQTLGQTINLQDKSAY